MRREELVEMTRHNIAHVKSASVNNAESIYKVDASSYLDAENWQRERERIFRSCPIVLALSCEIPGPLDYKATEVAGMPVLITRDQSGKVRAMANVCTHRGARLVQEGTGKARLFMCPYHGWSFSSKGDLVAVASEEEFGSIDKSCHGLKTLPVYESAGLIWVVADPKSELSIPDFLCGFDELLSNFGFENWHLFDRRILKGPNWKVAWDGYLDFYHLPVLHKETFKDKFANRALFYNWGPHQRMVTPDPSLLKLEEISPSQWPLKKMLKGVWTIFPNTSIVSIDGKGKSIMLSQMFPGEDPETSYTVQNYIVDHELDDQERQLAHDQFKLLEYVLQNEDYATGYTIQASLKSGALDAVMFGRNEKGGQLFHHWVKRIADGEMPGRFAQAAE